MVPPCRDGAVAPGVRGAASVAAGELVCEVGAVQLLVGGAEVGDGGLDLVAVGVEGGLVVDAARLSRAELDAVASAMKWVEMSASFLRRCSSDRGGIGSPARRGRNCAVRIES